MNRIKRELQVAPWEHCEVELPQAVLDVDLKLAQDAENADLWMERGLALAKAALYRESVEAYSRAIAIDPFRGIFYRHRGHRLISCWRFEEACADFAIAARLIPDNWDVWYHYGLAYFLLRDYKNALRIYEQCYAISNTEEKLIAITDWLWITLNRLGEKERAAEYLDKISPDFDPGENGSYFMRLLLYKGLKSPEELLPSNAKDIVVRTITMGFGLSNYYDVMGDRKKSDEVIEMVIKAGDEMELHFAFGYLAAKVDKTFRALKR